MAEPWHVLVIGSTGYIGGSVLSTLMKSNNKYLVRGSVSALVRGKDKEIILEEKGYRPWLFEGLDSTDQLTGIAAHFDLIVNCAPGSHTASAKALIKGLAMRSRRIEKECHYIHTTGVSNLADQPITNTYHESRIFSDQDNDIYAYEQERNTKQPYAQRQTDFTVIQTGIETGVKTYLIMSPLIYGLGSGHFNRLSIQVPLLIRTALKAKQAEVIGEGKGEWDHVHIDDLVALYELLVAKIVAGEEIPSGEEGFYFSGNGRHTWRDVAQGVGDALLVAGVGKGEVRSISLQEGAERWTGGDSLFAELAFASNARTKSERGRSLGWTPQKGERDFKNHFQAELEAVCEQLKSEGAETG